MTRPKWLSLSPWRGSKAATWPTIVAIISNTVAKTMNEKNILLINPWIHDFAAYDLWMKPLGLLYLGSILRKNGHRVSLVNCLNWQHLDLARDKSILPPKRIGDGRGELPRTIIPKPAKLAFFTRYYRRYGISPEIFMNDLSEIPKPDIILVTSLMTYWYPGVFEAIGLLRQVFPQVPVILGGNYATLCPEHARTSGADAIVAGEGERYLAGIFKKYLGSDLTFLPNFADLDSYPYPALDLLGTIDQVPLRTSRGCPYRCTYCASFVLHEGFSQRKPELVAREIDYWHKKHGVIHFSLYDDAFLVNRERLAIPLLGEIIKRRPDCFFHAPNGLHIREIDPLIADLLFRAGFKTLRLGFETTDAQKQRETGGKVANDELLAAISYLTEAGYGSSEIGVYILTGLPGQSAEEVKRTIHFVKSSGATPIIAEYSPIPFTTLWEAAVAESRYDLHEPLFHNNTILSCQNDRLTYRMYESLKNLARGKNPLTD